MITAVCGVKRVPSFYLFLKSYFFNSSTLLLATRRGNPRTLMVPHICHIVLNHTLIFMALVPSKRALRNSNELTSIFLEVSCDCCSLGFRENLCPSPISWVSMHLMGITIKERSCNAISAQPQIPVCHNNRRSFPPP